MIKETFSKILAAAIVDLAPGAQIVRAGLSYHGFYCDFRSTLPLSAELLERLSERMRQIIREKRDVRVLEMVPFSASEMLKKQGQRERASQVSKQSGLVRIVRLGEFADWCGEERYLPTTGGGLSFRLLSQTGHFRGRVRVFGIVAESKKELKELSSIWDRFEERDHEKVGCKRGLWHSSGQGGRLWLPKGLEARDRLSSFWQEAFAQIAQPVEGGQGALELLAEIIPSSMELLMKKGGCGERGLLDASLSLALSFNHFLDLHPFSTSFLQTIQKSLTILGFAYRIRCIGKKRKGCPLRRSLSELGWDFQEWDSDGDPKLEFLLEDALRSEWVVAEIGEFRLKGLRGLAAAVWIEKNLALLIEKSDGSLPFWPVQKSGRVD